MLSIKNIAKAVIICCAALTLQACATKGPTFAEMPQAQQGPKPDMARVYVYRSSIVGAAVQPSVMINDQKVGDAVPLGFFYLDEKPGTYRISTATEVERTLDLTLEPGQTAYVRLGISVGFFVGHVYPELVEAETGKKELASCHFTGDQPN